MLFSDNESTEDILVRLLFTREMDAKELHGILVKSEKREISLQAVYKAIKHLVDSSVLVKRGTLFTVSQEWINSLTTNLHPLSSLHVSEGESVSYSFKSLSSLDSYWKHIIIQLHEKLGEHPIFFYNTHVVWIHLADRKKSQNKYLKQFDIKKRYAYFTVGGNTTLDKEFKKLFYKEYLQIELRKIDALKPDSVTVHGDYVITVKFDKKTTNNIDTLYKNNKKAKDLEKELEKLFMGKLSVKLKIELHSKKAKKLRKILSKNFFIPKEVRDKFNLF